MATRANQKRIAASAKGPAVSKKSKCSPVEVEEDAGRSIDSTCTTKRPPAATRRTPVGVKGRQVTASTSSTSVAPDTAPSLPRGTRKRKQPPQEEPSEPLPTKVTGTLKRKYVKKLPESLKTKEKVQEPHNFIEVDSDDEPDHGSGPPPKHEQETMDGRQASYLALPGEEEDEDDEDEVDDGAMDLSTISTRLRQSIQDTSVFDDPTKKHETWWKEDPTREKTLVDLWHEEKSLYDVSEKSHMSEDRTSILKRFSTVLHVPPHIIDTKMQSMRNMYQSLYRQCKSGSSPIGKTPRQREVLKLLFFLRQHIKTTPSLTSYKGESPAKASVVHGRSVPISTPKGKGKGKKTTDPYHAEEAEEGEPHELSELLQNTLTPIGKPSDFELDSDDKPDSGEEFVVNTKHFSRNERLRDERSRKVVAKRSLDLESNDDSQEPTVLKTSLPVPPKCSSKKTTQVPQRLPQRRSKDPSTSTSSNEITVIAQVHSSEDGPDTKLHRKKKMKTTVPAKQLTAEDRAKMYQELKARDIAKNLELAKKKPTTTAAQRKEMMAPEKKNYDTEVDPTWYDKQGPGYRKQLEAERKKKDKDRDDKFTALMAEKNENHKKLTEGLKASTAPETQSVIDTSPEQLWADSLVPYLKRMNEEVKDDFMVHVLALSVKAIRGKWP